MTLGGSLSGRYDESEVFACSDALVLGQSWHLESGLFDAIRMAYSGHHHLHLRPDDIWLAVGQGVSAHLEYQDNAEKYRHVFVDHEGKEIIEVIVDDFRTGEKAFNRSTEVN